MADELFKTTLMGGYDKDDVLNKMQIMKEEAYAEKSKLIKAGKEKDAKIEELNKRLDLKDLQKEQALEDLRKEHRAQMEEMQQRLYLKEEQKDKLERQIQEKYQKYIDRYELIGSLVLDAQEKAEKTIQEAEEKAAKIIEEAQEKAECITQNAEEESKYVLDSANAKCEKMLQDSQLEVDRRLTKVQLEVDDKLAEGKRKYLAVQEEMNEIIELINQAQKRFMTSYKEVHRIVSAMPESMRELEDDNLESSLAEKETAGEEMCLEQEVAVEESGSVCESETKDLCEDKTEETDSKADESEDQELQDFVVENLGTSEDEFLLDSLDEVDEEDEDFEKGIFRIVNKDDFE